MSITIDQGNHPQKSMFSKLRVAEVMRRDLIILPGTKTIAVAIQAFIKWKRDGVLVQDENARAVGVVTKTETMGAYYGGLLIETPLADIMGAPVIYCSPDETLEAALLVMQQSGIHRIYILGEDEKPLGVLDYTDIVGTLYRFCCNCEYGLRNRGAGDTSRIRYTVRDVMTSDIATAAESSDIGSVIEQIAANRLGAVLILDSSGKSTGVISKTDLALAYRRGVPVDDKARKIMKYPVQFCHERELLEESIRRMILGEISRVFIYKESKEMVTGVLSLSDAARIRSGSCRACSSTRIRLNG